MSAPALYPLLAQQLGLAAPPCLLIADENTAVDRLPTTTLQGSGRHVLTNRWDIGQALRDRGSAPLCNDYQFDDFGNGTLQSIVYRIAKEKAAVHHIINRSGELLRAGGQLVLLGHKREGLAGYGKRAAAYFGGQCRAIRGDKGFTALALRRGAQLAAPLADDDYRNLRPRINVDGLALYSKPGIYGWQKVDRGSLALLEALQQISGELHHPEQRIEALDLGCGYGLLAVLASRQMAGTFVATDNNCAAIAACARNFAAHGVAGQVVLDDCARTIAQRFDLVLCNPPFHQGFATSKAITQRFTEQAARHLRPSGNALFVVNQFVGIEKYAAACFADQTELLRQDGFKVLRFARPFGSAK